MAKVAAGVPMRPCLGWCGGEVASRDGNGNKIFYCSKCRRIKEDREKSMSRTEASAYQTTGVSSRDMAGLLSE